jgi:hypothetical protein
MYGSTRPTHQFPKSRPWDHKIKMKEGFEPKLFKNYNLTLAEQTNWTNSSKRTLKRIHQTSQLPMASPFFFVLKKDGKL